MKTVKPNKTFIIRHKQTKEQWKASSGKSSWKAINHAKAAWRCSGHSRTKEIEPLTVENSNVYRSSIWPKFDEQDVYEVVELKPDSEDKLQEACELLVYCMGSLQPDMDNLIGDKILEFLEENYNEK